jgi:hypothetical protein
MASRDIRCYEVTCRFPGQSGPSQATWPSAFIPSRTAWFLADRTPPARSLVGTSVRTGGRYSNDRRCRTSAHRRRLRLAATRRGKLPAN